MEKQPMYWSIRRELWENRSIIWAPLAVAVFFMAGFMASTIGMPHRRRALMLLDPAKQAASINKPYDVVAMMLLGTAFLVGLFYCLDALHGERRDRSILFWKSLPVSDRTAVLSKASIPLVILPLLTFLLVVTTQIFILLWSTAVLLPSGLAGSTWRHVHFIQNAPILAYGLIVLALWHAPVYAWLLLVSGWARRSPLLWVVLPPAVLAAFEKVAFGSKYFGSMLKYRLMGGIHRAFIFKPDGDVEAMTPGRFLSTPGLWIGLVLAALFLAAAAQMRRNREPI
jgi:ABC-2 type transport system permease protein